MVLVILNTPVEPLLVPLPEAVVYALQSIWNELNLKKGATSLIELCERFILVLESRISVVAPVPGEAEVVAHN